MNVSSGESGKERHVTWLRYGRDGMVDNENLHNAGGGVDMLSREGEEANRLSILVGLLHTTTSGGARASLWRGLRG